MLSWTEPRQEELAPEPEAEWPGELPEYVEEWNQFWVESTVEPQVMGLAKFLAITPQALFDYAVDSVRAPEAA